MNPIQVIVKRNGDIVSYDRAKIAHAILKAAQATDSGHDRQWAENLAQRVEVLIVEKFGQNGHAPHVEDIQDIVEQVLIKDGQAQIAKAYILYREQHSQARDTRRLILDGMKLVDDYLDRADWRVNENANMNYSLQGLNFYVASSVTARYWLQKIYPPEIRQAHVEGALHIHDLGVLAAYCCGWDLQDLLLRGFGGVSAKTESKPPRHLRSALGQAVNFLYTLQGETAGAQAFSNFDTLLAPFARADGLSYRGVKQAIQEFVFNINVPTRVGFQTPFTNLTMDLIPPTTLRDMPVIIGGELQDETYGDFQPEMDMINRAYAEIMLEGDARGRVFTFPIPTYNIFKEFDWDNPALKPVWQMTAKYGIPYFSNFINSDMKPEDARSMCPLSGRTRVVVRSKQNGIRVEQIIHIINNMQVKGTEYKVLTPTGAWVKARPVKVATTDVYRVWLSNGVFVDMGENHLQPTMDKGTLLARELAVDMWLPFTRTSFESELGDYDLGYVVGAYLGDGSHDNESTIYSLCAFEKDDETERRLARIWNNLGFFVKVTQSERNVRFLRVSAGSYTMLRRFVKGSGALDKSLTRLVFNGSAAFKSGILDGYQATDGSREKKRLYTASESLRYDMAFLLSSLGRKYNISSYDDREDRFSKNVVYRIDCPERANYGDFYKEDNDYHYYRITKIERLADFNAEHLYCFQVDSAEHLFVLANGLVTHNCRLRLDNRELRKRGGGLFAANPLTGSIGVVTLNMARIGYLAENEEHFWTLLEAAMRLAQKSLEIKRKVLNQFTEAGLYPYSKYYLAAIKQRFDSYWANHFLTIAVNGMNECCLNFLGVDIFHQEAQDFSAGVLLFMRERIREFQLETDHLYNLEASPAESASFRLAKEDKARFPDIRTAGSDQAPYYTNSTHLPVNCTDDLFKALAHQDSLQVLYTGGTVFHGFLGEQIDDWHQARLLVRRIAENFHLPYFTLTPTFSICPVHGYLPGEHTFCPYEHTEEDLARFGVTI